MNVPKRIEIAVIGAGLGGATCAALFQQAGYQVDVYEQASEFTRLGAGIHLGPNCVRVLNHIGLKQRLLETAVRPAAWDSLMWDTGEILFSLPLRNVAEQRLEPDDARGGDGGIGAQPGGQFGEQGRRLLHRGTAREDRAVHLLAHRGHLARAG